LLEFEFFGSGAVLVVLDLFGVAEGFLDLAGVTSGDLVVLVFEIIVKAFTL
jgi:hypothetical protein